MEQQENEKINDPRNKKSGFWSQLFSDFSVTLSKSTSLGLCFFLLSDGIVVGVLLSSLVGILCRAHYCQKHELFTAWMHGTWGGRRPRILWSFEFGKWEGSRIIHRCKHRKRSINLGGRRKNSYWFLLKEMTVFLSYESAIKLYAQLDEFFYFIAF